MREFDCTPLEPAVYLHNGQNVWAASVCKALIPMEGHSNEEHLVLAYSPLLRADWMKTKQWACSLPHSEWFNRENADVALRIHSECLFGDVFEFDSCDCGYQLRLAIKAIEDVGCGLLIYLRQEGRGIGLAAKIRSMRLGPKLDTFERNIASGFPADARGYDTVVRILRALRVDEVSLISESPFKKHALAQAGVKIGRLIALERPLTIHSANELLAKSRAGYSVFRNATSLSAFLDESTRDGTA